MLAWCVLVSGVLWIYVALLSPLLPGILCLPLISVVCPFRMSIYAFLVFFYLYFVVYAVISGAYNGQNCGYHMVLKLMMLSVGALR